MDRKKALTVLYDLAEQELDRGGVGPGEWPELEEAMRLIGPETEYGPDYKGISVFDEDDEDESEDDDES